jgi:hypothetical protein
MQQMMAANPQFNQFVAANAEKSPEDICKDYGLNPDVLNLFKR